MSIRWLKEELSKTVDPRTVERVVHGLFTAPHVALWVKDLDLRYLHVSPAWQQITQLPEESVLGRRDEDFRPSDVAMRFNIADRRVIDTARSETYEDVLNGPGGLRRFTTTKFPLVDDQGHVFAVAGVTSETTTFHASRMAEKGMLAFLDGLLESNPDCIARLDAQLCFTFANPAFRAAFSPSGSEVVGARLEDVLGPTLSGELNTEIATLGPGRRTVFLERATHTYDAGQRWRRWRIDASADEADRISAYQILSTDVTRERAYQQALESLIASSQQVGKPIDTVIADVLRVGMDFFGMDEAAVVWAENGESPRIYARVSRLANQTPIITDPEPGVPCPFAVVDPDPLVVRDSLAEGTAYPPPPGRSLIGQRIVIGSGGGAVAFVSQRPRLANYEQDELTLMRLIAQWLSFTIERGNQIRALASGRAELAMILENVPAQVLTRASDGRLLSANAAARISGRPASSIAVDDAVLVDGIPRFGETERWENAEGVVRFMRTDRVPYGDQANGGRRLLVVAADVSELIEKEQALAKINEDLNQFAYIASHDLQEPLRKIGTFTDVLIDGAASGNKEDMAYAARVIKDSARRASVLIRDLLGWSRISNRPLERRALRFDVLVREVLEDVLSARPGHEVEIADTMDEVVVEADPVHGRQLIENLLVNAIKYRHPDRAPRLDLSLGRDLVDGQPHAIFALADNGIGFDAQHAERIFEPFRRLHSDHAYPGSGIGLAICRKVCDRHGWQISASATPGLGARFSVDLGRNQDRRLRRARSV